MAARHQGDTLSTLDGKKARMQLNLIYLHLEKMREKMFNYISNNLLYIVEEMQEILFNLNYLTFSIVID